MCFPTVAAHPIPIRARTLVLITRSLLSFLERGGSGEALHAVLLTSSLQNFLFNLFQTVHRGQSKNYWSIRPKCKIAFTTWLQGNGTSLSQ